MLRHPVYVPISNVLWDCKVLDSPVMQIDPLIIDFQIKGLSKYINEVLW